MPRFAPLVILSLSLGFAGSTAAAPDPQMQAVLDQLAGLGGKPIEKSTPDVARKQPGPPDAVKALLKKLGKSTDPEKVAATKDITIPGPAGKLAARVYSPEGEGPFPVLVYFHGGGWVIADIDAYDASCRALCNAAKCVVVSCDYRRAPENPAPAALDDAFAAYQWTLKHTKDWNGDEKSIAIAGESAGGNLATLVCIKARDAKIQMPLHQLLVYPVTDANFDTESYKLHADAKPLNKEMMRWFFAHYSGNQAPDKVLMLLPLQAKTLADLPPATIVTADIDPLRDDGKKYAAALEKAGVKVRYKNYEGVTHEFFGMGAVVDKSKDAVKYAAEGLTAAFKK